MPFLLIRSMRFMWGKRDQGEVIKPIRKEGKTNKMK